MIHVYYAPVPQKTDFFCESRKILPVWDFYLNGISDERRRFQSFCARVLLERALFDNGVPTEGICLGDSGRWGFYPPNGADFSLSHSARLVAVAVSDKFPVGVDAEKVSRRLLRVKTKLLCDDGFAARANGETEIEFLTRVWTERESAFKAGAVRTGSAKTMASKTIFPVRGNDEYAITVAGECREEIENARFIEIKNL